MLKVPLAGKDHCDAVFVRCFDDYWILFGAARLDYRGDAYLGGVFDVVREREERIRGHDRVFSFVAGTLEGD